MSMRTEVGIPAPPWLMLIAFTRFRGPGIVPLEVPRGPSIGGADG